MHFWLEKCAEFNSRYLYVCEIFLWGVTPQPCVLCATSPMTSQATHSLTHSLIPSFTHPQALIYNLLGALSILRRWQHLLVSDFNLMLLCAICCWFWCFYYSDYCILCLLLQYKTKTLNPKWLEQFDLHMFDDQTSHLEIAVYDHDTGGRDDIMGR